IRDFHVTGVQTCALPILAGGSPASRRGKSASAPVSRCRSVFHETGRQMPGIPSDYLVEVPYPPQFHREHSPLWLDTVLTALGQRSEERRVGGERRHGWVG